MFGGNNSNNVLPVLLDENCLEYQTNVPNNQLQLFGKLNHFGNEPNTSMLRQNKRGRESEDLQRPQKLQMTLNCNMLRDEVPKQNPVSTGLRLSYDDDERNSSVTSASGRMPGGPSILLSMGDCIRTELEHQKAEFDHYIKVQEEHMAKGMKDLKQKHMTSFMSTLDRCITNKLREKDMELDTINHNNRELSDRIKQVAAEAQNWHYRAKYSESVINLLKTNLQQALSQGVAAEQGKEGFGDSEVDDAVSYMAPKMGLDEHLMCRVCRSREVSVLLMPCRHLCVCKECDGLAHVCPVCTGVKAASVEVYLS